ncbi:MAG TPA: diaminopimelate epimerase [Thiothrix sp.]|nr:diaminopimelate epimerase [Thiothrix sp.]
MTLQFSKMHGLGNDFVVIDAINQAISLNNEQIRYLADRRLGVGCDQVLLVEDYAGDDADFRYRIFNADGGEVEQCGNGARCFAQFVRDQGLTDKTTIPVMTQAGRIILQVADDGAITVDMGQPRFQPPDLPITATSYASHYQLVLDQQTVEFGAVSMGNPHAVLLVDDITNAPVATWGKTLESHAFFPQRVNVGFMQMINRQQIRLRVFERGAGETQACGTGACAAMVIGRSWGLLDDTVQVQLSGGELHIQWAGRGHSVFMTGAATQVFTGTITV